MAENNRNQNNRENNKPTNTYGFVAFVIGLLCLSLYIINKSIPFQAGIVAGVVTIIIALMATRKPMNKADKTMIFISFIYGAMLIYYAFQ